MKKILLISLVLVGFSCFGQKANSSTNIKIGGIYIFIESEPLTTYTILATKKFKVDFSTDPGKDLERAVKKAKKEFPNVDGLVFWISSKHLADIIVFKDEK